MFRFTIRDVLWLTVVVALSVGWWVSYAKQRTSYKRLSQDFVNLQDLSGYFVETKEDGTRVLPPAR